VSKWTTIQVQLPDVLKDLAEILNSLIGTLLAILEVVRTILNIVKTLLVGLLDPISAIIELIIAEIEALLNDIRQLGVYIALDEIDWPFDNLIGGFTAYEQRMIKRLVDRTDITRPAFTTRSAVVAIFLYVSFDSANIQAAIALIDAIKRFFNIGRRSRTFSTPIGLIADYGTQSSALGVFGPVVDFLKREEEPAVAVLRWQMAPPRNVSTAWPLPPPHGFIIEVSTVPNGITLAYTTTPARAQIGDRVSGIVTDPEGKPFQLFGGLGIFDPVETAWTANGNTFTPPADENGKVRVFGFKTAADSVAIPPNAFKIGDKYVLQRTFYKDASSVLGAALLSPGQPFSFVLNQEEMPYDATFEDAGNGKVRVVVADEPAREVYVRVSAVTREVTKTGHDPATSFYWTFDVPSAVAGSETKTLARLITPGMSTSAKSDPSVPIKLTYPSLSTAEYLKAVTTSIAILILSRSDLAAVGTDDVAFQPDTAAMPTGLEALARFIVPQTLGPNTARFFKKTTNNPTKFRRQLLNLCEASANAMLQVTGILPTELENVILEQAVVTTATGTQKPIYDVTWRDLDPSIPLDVTILDSLNNQNTYGSQTQFGVAPNPLSVGVAESWLTNSIGYGIILDRRPGFLLPVGQPEGAALMGKGSADNSPVLYDMSTNTMKFCRNVFLNNYSSLTAALAVLNVSAAPLTYVRKPGEGAWKAYRLFPNGIPPVDAALNEIIGFLNAIKDSITSIADAIVAYIEFIEARILELEGLLRRIQSLLDVILAIEVPLASGLVVTANGTDGILTALTTAEDKPVDGSPSFARVNAAGKTIKAATYGAGVVVLAGGLPTAVAELLQLLFVPSED
jgi:hypothetical protein